MKEKLIGTKRCREVVKALSDFKWHTTVELANKLGYVHINRALTDVRQAGYELEEKTTIVNGKRVACYKLKSSIPSKILVRKRITLSKDDTKKIFERDHHTCVFCNETFPESRLRADHKSPITRQGNHFVKDVNNKWMDYFQTVCIICNYRKREICKRCETSNCEGCELYDPRKYGGVYIKLGAELLKSVREKSENSKMSLQDYIRECLKKS